MNSTPETGSGDSRAAPPGPRPLPWRLRLLLPWLRRELPMWGRIYRWLGGERHELYCGAGHATVRGKLCGSLLDFDLANWSERLSFCLGRYHDLPIQLALQQVLRPGDAFVDVGANLGLVAMLASRLVGPSGRVVACEPNPAVLERLRAALQHNGIGNVEVVAAALGEAPGAAELRVYGGHSGWGSLAAEGPPELTAAATHRVELRTGDAVLGPLPPAQPLVIKIDVEGHELPVLRGLRRTLAARLPLVFLEVADVHQRRAGHSAAALLGELERYGYVGYGLTSRRTLGGHRLGLEPVAGRSGGEFDAVFVPDRGPLRERLAALLP